MRGCLSRAAHVASLPPSSSSKALHRAAAPKALTLPPPSCPSMPIAEGDVGISCFVSSLPGFSAVLKLRYADFIVNEVDRDGRVIHLTSFDLPAECIDVDVKDEENIPTTGMDYSNELKSFEALCGDKDTQTLRALLENISSGSDKDISHVVLSPDPDKNHRANIHDFFKKHFKFLVTDTIEGIDSSEKCIRVRLSSQSAEGRGRRGKKRKDMDSSGMTNSKPFDSRGSNSWPDHLGKFLRFHLYKENKDTQDALGVIGKMLGIQQRSFGFAGTKDKRAITTQQVTLYKVHAQRLAALNDRLFGIKVGDFRYVDEELVLGQLSGNRFTITLRSVAAESEEVVKAAAGGLGNNGFINYYGLQRFGSGSVPTHLVGAALLRGEWKGAVELILDPREGERDDVREAREYYKEHGDADGMLKMLPRYLVAERAILQCLKKYPGNYVQALKGIPRTLRMMYVHSYQSYLWNHAASARVEKYGLSEVVLGDIVFCQESSPSEAIVSNGVETEGDYPDISHSDISCEIFSEEKTDSVKVVCSDDLEKGLYTIEDVVLPLPGSRALFPENEVADIYHQLAMKDGISLTESTHSVKEFAITNLKGGFRRIYQRPIDFEWELLNYTEDTVPLAESDLDIMRKAKDSEMHKVEPNSYTKEDAESIDLSSSGSSASAGKILAPQPETVQGNPSPPKIALKLKFTLPASSYATMAIRELLKNSTSVAYQKKMKS